MRVDGFIGNINAEREAIYYKSMYRYKIVLMPCPWIHFYVLFKFAVINCSQCVIRFKDFCIHVCNAKAL